MISNHNPSPLHPPGYPQSAAPGTDAFHQFDETPDARSQLRRARRA